MSVKTSYKAGFARLRVASGLVCYYSMPLYSDSVIELTIPRQKYSLLIIGILFVYQYLTEYLLLASIIC